MRAIVFAVAGVVATVQAVSGNARGADCANLHLAATYSSVYGRVDLAQRGCAIAGTYYDDASGRITGRVDGNMIRFRWSEGGDSAQGRGVWVVASDGELFGHWGSGDTERGGDWDLAPAPTHAAIAR